MDNETFKYKDTTKVKRPVVEGLRYSNEIAAMSPERQICMMILDKCADSVKREKRGRSKVWFWTYTIAETGGVYSHVTFRQADITPLGVLPFLRRELPSKFLGLDDVLLGLYAAIIEEGEVRR